MRIIFSVVLVIIQAIRCYSSGCLYYLTDSNPNSCVICSWGFYNPSGGDIFKDESCIAKSDPTGSLVRTVYISPRPATSALDALKPQFSIYDNLVDSLIKEDLLTKSLNSLSQSIFFKLLKGDHYILQGDFKGLSTNLFERNLVSISIEPLLCADAPTELKGFCFDASEKARVFLKANNLKIFITKSLTLRNLILDGTDLNTFYQKAACKEETRICCQADDSCAVTGQKYIFSEEINSLGLFNLEPIIDLTPVIQPNLIILTCNFKKIILESTGGSNPSALIAMSDLGGYIEVRQTVFDSIFSAASVFNKNKAVRTLYSQIKNLGLLFNFSAVQSDVKFVDCTFDKFNERTYAIYDATGIAFSSKTSLFFLYNYQGSFTLLNSNITNSNLPIHQLIYAQLNKDLLFCSLTIDLNTVINNTVNNIMTLTDTYNRLSLTASLNSNFFGINSMKTLATLTHVKSFKIKGSFLSNCTLPANSFITTSFSTVTIYQSLLKDVKTDTYQFPIITELSIYPATSDKIFTTAKRTAYICNDTTEFRDTSFVNGNYLLYSGSKANYVLTIENVIFENISVEVHKYKPFIDIFIEGPMKIINTSIKGYRGRAQLSWAKSYLKSIVQNVSLYDVTVIDSDVIRFTSITLPDFTEHILNITNYTVDKVAVIMSPENLGKIVICIICAWSTESGKGVTVNIKNVRITNTIINLFNINHYILRFDNVLIKVDQVYGKNITNAIFFNHNSKTATSDISLSNLTIENPVTSPLIKVLDFGQSYFTNGIVIDCYFYCENMIHNVAVGFNLAQNLTVKNLTVASFQNLGTLLFAQVTKITTLYFDKLRVKSLSGSGAALFTLQTENEDQTIPWENETLLTTQLDNGLYNKVGFRNSIFENSNGGAVILLFKTQVMFANCTFDKISSKEGGILKMIQNSRALFFNCSVTSALAVGYGGTIFTEGSVLIFIRVSVKNSKSGINGGVISAIDSSLIIKSSYFFDCKSLIGGMIFSDNTKVSVTLSSFEKSLADKFGGHLVIKFGELNITKSSLKLGVSLYLGGSLYLEGLNFFINETEFKECESKIGTIYTLNGDYSKVSKLNFVRFLSNKASKGGAVIFSSDANILLTDSDLKLNKAESGFLVLAVGLFSNPKNTFNNTRITNNYAFSGLFSFEEAFVLIENSAIFENTVMMAKFMSLTRGSFKTYRLYFSFCNSTFKDCDSNLPPRSYIIKSRLANITISSSLIQMRKSLGFLDCTDCSDISCENTLLREGYGELGGIFHLKNSRLNASVTDFVLSYGTQGGALYATGSQITLGCVRFYKNIAEKEGSDLYIYNPVTTLPLTISISLALFKSISWGSAHLESNLLVIEKVGFYGDQGVMSQALRIEKSVLINISNSEFKNFLNDSTIFILSDGSTESRINIFNSVFENTLSPNSHGGFISTSGNSELNMVKCKFSSGKANRGGAIYFSCSNNKCPIKLINVIFNNNVALEMGGALSSESLNMTEENSTYSENSAPVGPNTNFFPTKFALFVPVLNYKLTKDDMLDALMKGSGEKLTKLSESNPLLSVRPGYNFSVGIAILDPNDNIQFNEKGFKATITVIKNSSDINKTREFNFLNNLAEVSGGFGIFEGIILVGETRDKFKAKISYRNAKFSIQTIIDINVLACKRGDSYQDFRCMRCQEHFFSLNPKPEDNNQVCLVCPDNSECPGGDVIIPAEDYWRKDGNTSLVLACKTKNGCPVQSPALFNSSKYEYSCAEGYEGYLCDGCSSGYGNVKNECYECSSSKPLFALLVISGFIIYLAYLLFQEKSSERKSTDQDIALVKILTNHISIFIILAAVKVNWSSLFKDFFTISSSYVSTTPSTIYSFECFFNWDKDQKLVNTLILAGFSPFIINVLAFFTNLVLLLFHHLMKKKFVRFHAYQIFLRLHTFKSWLFFEFFKHLVIIFFNIYPQILLNFFNIFGCKTIDDTEDKYLVQYPWVRCNSDFHKGNWSLSMFFIIFWGVFIPFTIGISVKKGYKELILQHDTRKNNLFENFESEIKNEVNLKTQAIMVESVKRNKFVIVNFTTKGYKPKYYYWELLIYSRKILFLCIATFSEEMDTLAIGGLAIFLLSFFQLMTLKLLPYESEKLNILEVISLLVSIISIIMGIITSLGDEVSSVLKAISSIILIIANLFFIFLWLIFFSRKLALKLFPRLITKLETKMKSMRSMNTQKGKVTSVKHIS